MLEGDEHTFVNVFTNLSLMFTHEMKSCGIHPCGQTNQAIQYISIIFSARPFFVVIALKNLKFYPHSWAIFDISVFCNFNMSSIFSSTFFIIFCCPIDGWNDHPFDLQVDSRHVFALQDL